MNDLINNEDTYLEHDKHIVSESGKIVPFFRNMKSCSTCYSEHKKLQIGEKKSLQGSGWDYPSNDYKLIC